MGIKQASLISTWKKNNTVVPPLKGFISFCILFILRRGKHHKSLKKNNNTTFIFLVSTFLCLFFSATAIAVDTVGFLAGAGGLGDQSFNDMTFSGLGRAQKEYNFKIIIEETQPFPQSREKAMDSLIKQGAEIIIANGSGLFETVLKYSQMNPERYFIVNDSAIEGYPNVTSTVFANDEGSYLVGLLAAAVSTTKSIGFIGGVNIPVIHTFLQGYIKGAKTIDPHISIHSHFLSPANDYTGFENPILGHTEAVKMYNKGIDVIFSVAGLSGNGIIQAAREKRKLVIGVDANQDHMAKGNVLTSMMKRLDRATYLELSKILEDRFEPGVQYYSLKNGGVSLTPMQYTQHIVAPEIMQLLKDAERSIISGDTVIIEND